MVSGYDLKNSIELSFSLDSKNQMKIRFKSVWENNPINGMPVCKLFEYDNGEDFLTIEIKDNQYFFTNEKNETTLYDSLPKLKQGIEKWYGEINFLHKDIEELRNYHFNFINSYRIGPDRNNFRVPKAEIVKPNGSGYENVICEWSEMRSPKFIELVDAMKELGLVSDIKVKTREQGDFDLQVQTKENGIVSSLIDVGFGVSKILPAIVADLQLNQNSILAISEPEIDLHPSIQADFADYLSKQVRTNGKQYIIETHSEYLLNRIRLLIAKGELNESDVEVYYFENDGEKSDTCRIQFKKNGEIIGAPDNFFKTYLIDTMQLAMSTFDYE